MPVVEFMAQSNRAGNLGAYDRYVFSLSPSRLIGAFWPNVTGTVATAQDWPQGYRILSSTHKLW